MRVIGDRSCQLGKWDSTEQACTIPRPPLLALLSVSSVQHQLCFWILFIGGNILLRIYLHAAYVCFLLAWVEDDQSSKALKRDEDTVPVEGAIQVQPRGDDARWGSVATSTAGPTSRGGNIDRSMRLAIGAWQTSSRTLRNWLIWDPADERLVTRDLRTCVRQLRCHLGNTWWPLRAAGSHILWWGVIRRSMVWSTAMSLYASAAVVHWLESILIGLLWKHRFLLLPSWPFICLAEVLVQLMGPPPHPSEPHEPLMPHFLAFPALRILSQATGTQDNVVTHNLRDSKLFDPDYYVDWRSQAAYGVTQRLTNVAGYAVVAKLALNSDNYILDDKASVIESGLILSSPASILHLCEAYGTWLLLRAVCLTPTFVLMTYDQCQALNAKESTIVKPDRVAGWHTWSLTWKVTYVAKRAPWRRLFRLTFQLVCVFGLFTAAFCLAARSLLTRMSDSHLVLDWVVREYLDFEIDVKLSGMLRDSFFWLYWQRTWVSTAA